MAKSPVVKPFVPPKTLGACADLLYKLREERLTQVKVVTAIEDQEKLLREHIIQNLPKSDQKGAIGKLGKVTLGSKTVAQVKDWDLFYKYIAKSKNFALLQRRPGESAIQEIWDAKKPVPGVEPFTIVTLSVTKA